MDFLLSKSTMLNPMVNLTPNLTVFEGCYNPFWILASYRFFWINYPDVFRRSNFAMKSNLYALRSLFV